MDDKQGGQEDVKASARHPDSTSDDVDEGEEVFSKPRAAEVDWVAGKETTTEDASAILTVGDAAAAGTTDDSNHSRGDGDGDDDSRHRKERQQDHLEERDNNSHSPGVNSVQPEGRRKREGEQLESSVRVEHERQKLKQQYEQEDQERQESALCMVVGSYDHSASATASVDNASEDEDGCYDERMRASEFSFKRANEQSPAIIPGVVAASGSDHRAVEEVEKQEQQRQVDVDHSIQTTDIGSGSAETAAASSSTSMPPLIDHDGQSTISSFSTPTLASSSIAAPATSSLSPPSITPNITAAVSAVDSDSAAPAPVISAWGVEEDHRRYEELQRRARILERERSNAPHAEIVEVGDDEPGDDGHRRSGVDGEDVGSNMDGAKKSRRLCQVASFVMIAIVLVAIAIVVVTIVGTDDRVETIAKETESSDNFTNIEPPIDSPTKSPLPDYVASQPTLQNIQNRGYVKCIGQQVDLEQGQGYSIDMCSAIAAALLGDPAKYEMVVIPPREQYSAIANGVVDVATGRSTHTLERDVHEPTSNQGMFFSTPYFYTGTTFAGIPEFVDCADRGETLLGACRDLAVCVIEGTTSSYLVRSYLGGSATHTVMLDDKLFENLMDGTCNVVSSVQLVITEQAARDAGYSGEYVFAPRFNSRDPLAFIARQDDPEFGDMINWIFRALVVAEARGISQSSADMFPTTNVFGDQYTHIFRLAIAAVGNYGEMYSRSWEDKVARGIGINSLHMSSYDGGLLYAIPLGQTDNEKADSHLGSTKNGTMAVIEGRKKLHCGILTFGRPGMAEWNDTTREWTGIDVDYCRGLASALFAGKVANSLVLLAYESLADGFVALSSGELDVLAGATYNIVNDVREPTTLQGFSFSDIYYYLDEGGDVNATVHPLAMATRQDQDDPQWSDFVRAMIMSTIYAESINITQLEAVDMPLLELFGPLYRQSFRDILLSIGNYAEIYQRNMESHVPRLNNLRNTLNEGRTPMMFANWDF